MQKKLNNKGFTIVEVLIVLAIAGAILAGILVAVPALQRNSRNTIAKQAANQIVAAIADNTTANNGSAPTVSFANGVLKLTGSGSTPLDTTISINGVTVDTSQTTAPSAKAGTVYVVPKGICTNGATTMGTSASQFSVVFAVETSAATSAGCLQG